MQLMAYTFENEQSLSMLTIRLLIVLHQKNSTTSSNDDNIDFDNKIPAIGATSTPIDYETLVWGSPNVNIEQETLLPVVVLESKKTVETLQNALMATPTTTTIEAPNIDEQHVSTGVTFSTWITIEGAPPTQSPTPDTILRLHNFQNTFGSRIAHRSLRFLLLLLLLLLFRTET